MWKLNALGVFESDLLSREPWLTHGFGCRLSEGWPDSYTGVEQIHSGIVHTTAHQNTSPGKFAVEKGDALVTATPGTMIGIRTADCVPILLADPKHRAVAAIHAGWRGSVAQIAVAAVRRMQQEFESDPADLLAAIGPAIGECCFEVGPEVAREFQPWYPNVEKLTHISLPWTNSRQLLTAGLTEQHIDLSGLCTKCDAEKFHSFRRDGTRSGRMVAAIGVAG